MSDKLLAIVPAVADIAGGGIEGIKLWECVTPGPDGELITGLGDDFFEARTDLARKIKESGMLPEGTTHVRLLITTRKTFELEDL